MKLTRRFFILAAPVAVTGCGAAEPVWAPQSQVDRVTYRHPGPASLTLYTMRRRQDGRVGAGMHTGLLISGSQRLLFDPAGSFAGSGIVERNDVIYGMTPALVEYYISYHARETYYIEIQEVEVAPQVAELALRLAQNYGAVGKSQCAVATGNLLKQLPGFGFITPGLWPGKLSAQFAEYPGVTSRTYYENDSADKAQARAIYEAQARARSQS